MFGFYLITNATFKIKCADLNMNVFKLPPKIEL